MQAATILSPLFALLEHPDFQTGASGSWRGTARLSLTRLLAVLKDTCSQCL
jgi:hypothetical protein